MAEIPSPPPPGTDDLEMLVLDVFSRVWNEFSVADTEYCEAAIGALAAATVTEDVRPSLKLGSETETSQDANSCPLPSPDPLKPHLPRAYVETDIPTVVLPPAVKPYPAYEGWT